MKVERIYTPPVVGVARVLIVFSSFDGQSAHIAERIGAALACRGLEASAMPLGAADLASALARHDAVLVGGGVRYGRHAAGLEAAVRANAAALSRMPNAFFSVSMAAARPAKGLDHARHYVEEFVERTGWHPQATATFAGALRYSRYSPFIRFMMRLIAAASGADTDTSRDHEYTDWAAVERFAGELAARLEPVAA